MNDFLGELCDKRNKNDFNRIVELLRQSFNKNPNGPTAENDATMHWIKPTYSDAYLFKSDEKIVGFCIVKLFKNARYLKIERIYTIPQKMGYGSKVIEWLKEKYKQNIDYIRAEINDSRAEGFYKRLNFVNEEKKENSKVPEPLRSRYQEYYRLYL